MGANDKIPGFSFTGLLVQVAELPLAALRGRPQWFSLLVALVMVGVIGWIDRVTGWEWSLFLFYAFPIVLGVWRIGKRAGIAFACLCTVVWWAANVGINPYETGAGFAVAVISRFFYFGVLVVAAAAVKEQQESDRARIESLKRERELERRILVAGEREQQRIGRDLHDSIGPHLAAVGYAAAFLANDLRQRHQPEAVKAERIREMISDAVSLTRDLARGIFPVQIEGNGLAIALEELARNASGLTGLPVDFCETGNPQVADPEMGMHLYRIAQEALANALKHSGARKITMALHQHEDLLRLAVTDDGCGKVPASNDTPGMGLSSMRYRARALGGVLMIESHPGRGTVVSCEIPPHPTRPATHPS
ncbi:MAG: sensor histidine kinase [Verrucomicrobia bacterium]|nr:sensor histidine kinase [Verrucomicrobiota bacterium]